MAQEFGTSFLTNYLQSLAERSREEIGGTKFGFDWIIYNLALAEQWTPVRLPFIRRGPNETPKTKTESEFGVDFAFVSSDKTTLRVFVLKDEVLTYANFTKKDFLRDLQMASLPDLTRPGLENIATVEVILAYNQDEHREGVELFDRFVAAQPARVGDQATLRFARWNLTDLVSRVTDHLLTPALLPQKFFSLFSYVCAQAADFRHGSDQWSAQLVSNWRRFLNDVLAAPVDERRMRLIPVALLILHSQASSQSSCATGWLDLTEWAMLRMWQAANEADDDAFRSIARAAWSDLYIRGLEQFYRLNAAALTTEHSLEQRRADWELGAFANAFVAFWHLGRIGILAEALFEFSRGDNEQNKLAHFNNQRTLANLMVGFSNANPACFRPILDVNHVELFLTWQAFLLAERKDAIHDWLYVLRARLQMRRYPISGLPFIDDRNSWEMAFESVASKEEEPQHTPKSSHLLLMLLECALVLDEPGRSELVKQIYRELVQGLASDGERPASIKSLDLLTWVPPEGWETSVLTSSVFTGESVVVALDTQNDAGADLLVEQLEKLVRVIKASRPFELSGKIPASVLLLATLKYRSPLPPFFWRQYLQVAAAEVLSIG
jgi:hypothetical protein